MIDSQIQWNSGDPYEYFMGRWSKLMAPEYLNWLNQPSSLNWLDLGCGTGALSETILNISDPSNLTSVDPSEQFLLKAKERLNNKGRFTVGSATDIPFENGAFDIVVSGLALNFFPDLEAAMSEMKRVSKRGSIISAYVWDYSGRMDMIRYFWDAVVSLIPNSRRYDESVLFPICDADSLQKVFKSAALSDVKTTSLDIMTHFRNFDDYWNPFLGGQGPAPSYLKSLPEQQQGELRDIIQRNLPIEKGGSINLIARAIAVKGIV